MKTEPLDRLREILRGMEKIAVAFSGGVDSTFLLYVSRLELEDGVLALTLNTPLTPAGEMTEALSLVGEMGVRHLTVSSGIPGGEAFIANPPDRCYICKKELFTLLKEKARQEGFFHLADGTNADDIQDYRPGIRALEELGVRSPLKEAGLTKAMIRQLSFDLGLRGGERPASPCLATRIPFGRKIDLNELAMVARAEKLLRDLGFSECRVRHHGDVARIETTQEMQEKLFRPQVREEILNRFREIGFPYITVDLQGYRRGSLNETIDARTGKDGSI